MLYSCPFNLNRPANRVLWEVTNKCNMNCKHCLYYSDYQQVFAKDLPTEKVYRIIEQMKADGNIDEVWLSGGEPLLREDLLDIISKIHSSGMKPSVSTNGYLVSKELAIQLKANGVDYVHLSIDGINSDEHDSFRQKKGAFERVVNAADFLCNADIIVGATCIITWNNINDIEKIVCLALRHSIKVLSFYMVEPLGRGLKLNRTVDDGLMIKLSKEFDELKIKYDKLLHLELFRTSNDDEDRLKECKCYNFFTITNDGKLGGCPWLTKSEHSPCMVSMDKVSFIDARKIVQKTLRKFVAERKQALSNCKTCLLQNDCGRGCPAVSDVRLYDPLCSYLRKVYAGSVE